MKLVSGVSIVFVQADIILTVKLENSVGTVIVIGWAYSDQSMLFTLPFPALFFLLPSSLTPSFPSCLPSFAAIPTHFAFRTHIHKWAAGTTFLPTRTLLLHVHMGQAVENRRSI